MRIVIFDNINIAIEALGDHWWIIKGFLCLTAFARFMLSEIVAKIAVFGVFISTAWIFEITFLFHYLKCTFISIQELVLVQDRGFKNYRFSTFQIHHNSIGHFKYFFFIFRTLLTLIWWFVLILSADSNAPFDIIRIKNITIALFVKATVSLTQRLIAIFLRISNLFPLAFI